jgi:hypothetical protein
MAHDVRGMLADVNVQGHLPFLRRILHRLDLEDLLGEIGLAFRTFPELGLLGDLDDRSLWDFCQRDGWVLFTENRNDDGPDSLQATLADSWRTGHLPVLTLASKGRFEREPAYAERVAASVADLLFGIAEGHFRDQPRIYVPRAGGTTARTWS